MQATYSVFEAKTKLSEILRLVKRGIAVTISQRGQPVAQVIPLNSEKNQTLSTRLEEAQKLSQLKKGLGQWNQIEMVFVEGATKRFLKNR
jgi:prevent-host-death family protein